jgi:hypothetical protein
MKGIVYKIYCKDSSITEFYVGSSCDLHQRKITHKSDCNNNNSPAYNYKVYKFIRENGGYDNWDFEILLQVEVDSKEELRLNYEAKYQLDLKPELNVKQEGRTQKEYIEDNREKIRETQKEYKKNNKEEISKKQKEYRENNKEKIKQIDKKYYEDHKEEILEKKRKKCDCDCGGNYTYSGKTMHERTKKHKKKFILSLSV